MQNRATQQRPRLFYFLLAVGYASGTFLTLSDFESISSLDPPRRCIRAYDSPLYGCEADVKDAMVMECSPICKNAIEAAEAEIQQLCQTVDASSTKYLSAGKHGNLVKLLCHDLVKSREPTTTESTTMTHVTKSESSTVYPTTFTLSTRPTSSLETSTKRIESTIEETTAYSTGLASFITSDPSPDPTTETSIGVTTITVDPSSTTVIVPSTGDQTTTSTTKSEAPRRTTQPGSGGGSPGDAPIPVSGSSIDSIGFGRIAWSILAAIYFVAVHHQNTITTALVVLRPRPTPHSHVRHLTPTSKLFDAFLNASQVRPSRLPINRPHGRIAKASEHEAKQHKMAWSHLDITKPHLVYIILGGFTTLFMLCSSFIKERMYIGEATVATLCGVIFGPHAANLINPNEWGSVDIVTVEFSRIVLVVQCFAVGVELPKYYMEKHWRSVVFLLIPVMTFGWLVVSLVIWWMVPPLSWLESLVVAACVTATDPVLASSVVGKGKFAKRVPKHLRDLLSAESGCNDGMAFPFVYLSLYLIQYHQDTKDVSFHFVVYVILYECIFGAFYGFMIGYIARHGIKYAEERDMIDRESFLVFYFVVALWCAGSGSILGMDDLLVGFAAGVGFSNDGWFGEKTEESHVSNVIDLLLNLTYFVFLGTIIPWEQYNNGIEGLKAWRLVVIAIFVIFFRRIPIMMALKPFIPDIKTWREALFAGHFGPIGVGAIFVAILARAELEHDEPVPLSEMPSPDVPHYTLIYLVWPITTFLVVTSILVHGSSIAVFTLGKRINTLTLTMSYTTAPEDGPSWMNRLPRISSQSRSQAVSETSFEEMKEPTYPPGTLAPPTGPQGFLLRRQRDEENGSRPGSRTASVVSRKRKHKKWDDGIGPGGPVSQSAIFPQPRHSTSEPLSPTEVNEKDDDVSPSPPENTDSTLSPQESEKDKEHEKMEDSDEKPSGSKRHPSAKPVNVYEEGNNMIFENQDGDVLDVERTHDSADQHGRHHHGKDRHGKGSHDHDPHDEEDHPPPPTTTRPQRERTKSEVDRFWSVGGMRRKMSDMYTVEMEKRKDKGISDRKHEPARAYQFGNTIIVEDEDGEVVKTYELPTQKGERADGGGGAGGHLLGTSLKYMGLGSLAPHPEKPPEAIAEEGEASGTGTSKIAPKPGWTGFGGILRSETGAQRPEATRKKSVAQEELPADNRKIRFTIGGVGQRMTEEDFIRKVQKLDVRTRREVVDQSTASQTVKTIAKQDPPIAIPGLGADRDSESTKAPSTAPKRSESVSPMRRPGESSRQPFTRQPLSRAPSSKVHQPSEQQSETAVERKRRLAVLSSQGEDEETGETPAERRRREAALGMGGVGAADDSDDEGDLPERRGIRFAEPERGRK
ncbi:hypothetical protein G7046_g2642 [Stylonectria norvegica]|nr:hypothetical protein G7046_g2642 [Stylonectria norvegica]